MALVACLGLSSCGDKKLEPEARRKAADERFTKRLSPEQRVFYDLCKKAKKGMNEKEVDALLSGYPQRRSDIPHETDYIKEYDEKPGAIECTYVFSVRFDEQHLVVNPQFTEYIK